MAQNVLVYDRPYNLGNASGAWKVRLRLNLRSTILRLSGAETNGANLTATSLADVALDSVSDFGNEIDANNVPGLKKISNVGWEIIDTDAFDFRTNVIIPSVNQASTGLRIMCRFDCDYGVVMTGAWSALTAYKVGDVASRSSVYYLCLQAHTNDAPPSSRWIVYECDANGFCREFTGICNPQETEADFQFADFAAGQMNEPFKMHATAFEELALEEENIQLLATVGPDYPDTATSLYIVMTDFNRAHYFMTHSPSGTPLSFDDQQLNGIWASGMWRDPNFAPLGYILRAASNYVRWAMDGQAGSGGLKLGYDLTINHMAFKNNAQSVGYPTNNLADTIVLGARTHLLNDPIPAVPAGAYAYCEYNMDASYTGGVASGGNYTCIADALRALLETFLLYANIYMTYDFSGVEKINIRVTAPTSPTPKFLIPNAPEQKTILAQHAVTPGFTPCNSASASIKRPSGIDVALTLDAPYFTDASTQNTNGNGENTPYDLFNPTFTTPSSRGGNGINATLLIGQFWDVWFENQLVIYPDPIGAPGVVVAADYWITTASDSGSYPPHTPVTFTQMWGGGLLNSFVPNVEKTITLQHAIALQLFSLYCGGPFSASYQKGIEKMVVMTPILTAMYGMMTDTVMRAVVFRGVDAIAHAYMVTGCSWNSWKVTGDNIRTAKLTVVRNID